MADKTDRQAKSSRWAFTAYEDQWGLFTTMPPGIAEWGWQREICPETNRNHYQGYLRLTQQQRFAWLAKILPGVHLEIPRNWVALVNYCKKTDTAVPGTQVHQLNTMFTKYSYAEHVGERFTDLFSPSEVAEMDYNKFLDVIKKIVIDDIVDGHREAAWIIVSPDWGLYWKVSWRAILTSHSIKKNLKPIL